MRLSDLPPDLRAQVARENGLGPAIAKPANARKQNAQSEACEAFALHLRAHNMGGWKREHLFAFDAMRRNWRFDFALVPHRLAVEIEGLRVEYLEGRAVCTGRHTTPDGYREDCRKYNAGVELGWHVLRFDQVMVESAEAIDTVRRVLARRGIA